jgi:hypothetical protein
MILNLIEAEMKEDLECLAFLLVGVSQR